MRCDAQGVEAGKGVVVTFGHSFGGARFTEKKNVIQFSLFVMLPKLLAGEKGVPLKRTKIYHVFIEGN